jgi:glucosyl-dolichyl phosphate glucuronosyltransferase
MEITVILCTYNRGHMLAKALQKVAASTLPESVNWEVLVVDNNSSDQTREVVEELRRRYPGRIRYLFEPQAGKSHALNAGVREAQGEVLAFMDDDVMVEPTWLQNLTAELHGSEWAGTGGRTLPAEAISLPRWLALEGPYALGGILAAMFDLGDEPSELDRAPYGANMAFHRQMFEKYGGFRTDLGPSPSREVPRPNEDTEFGRRLMAAGERLRYEPSAIVYHPVPAGRITKQYFLNWWLDYGRAASREVGKKPDVVGVPRHWISIPKMMVTLLVPRMFKWMLALNPQKRFYSKCLVWTTVGQMLEIRRQRRDAIRH